MSVSSSTKLVQNFGMVAVEDLNINGLEKKSLSQRVHRCDCGLTIGRDRAAAFVILERGLRLQAQTAGQLAPVA